MLPLSGKTIPVAILSYFCNETTNCEIRQGTLYLLDLPKEFEDLLLLGPGDWDTNGIEFNYNLSEGSTALTEELDITFRTPKECFYDFYGWLTDSSPSSLRDVFGRYRGSILEADEAVGNDVRLEDWAKKAAKKYRFDIPEGKIRTVALCSDFAYGCIH
jgi:hypothetical protein